MSSVSTILLAAIAAVLGGVVGGYVVPLKQAPVPKPVASAILAESDSDELSARIDTLERQVASLAQQRWSAVKALQEESAAGAGAGDKAVRAAPRAVDDPVFEAAVRDVLDRIEQDRSAERGARRAERQTQQAQRWADSLAQQAGLSDAQKARVMAIAQEYLQKLLEPREPDAGRPSPEQRDQRRSAVRAEAEKALGDVLSPRQMQAYKEGDGLQLDSMARGGGTRSRTGQ